MDQTTSKTVRGGIRINSRVKIAVEWLENGATVRVEGYTMDVSSHGCLAIMPQGFKLGQTLNLINLISGTVARARVMWQEHEDRKGWQIGLLLDDPPETFWELDF